jgi:hypothetical protein
MVAQGSGGADRDRSSRTPEGRAHEPTLARYTHVMPDAIVTARSQLDSWLAAQLSATATTG